MESNSRIVSLATRLLVDIVLAAHLVAAGFYWWVSPKGFAISHTRFWLNSVLPSLVIVACLVLLVVHRRRRDLAALAIMCLAFMWAAIAVTGNVLFPRSLHGVWSMGLGAILVGLFLSALLFKRAILRASVWLPCLLVSVCLGAFAMWAELPPAATTWPLNEPLPSISPEWQTAASAAPALGANYHFDPKYAQLRVMRGRFAMFIKPKLDFDRVSPDGFWSIFAPPKDKLQGQVSERPLAHVLTHWLEDDLHSFQYDDDSIVQISPPSTSQLLDVTSYTSIAEDTFTHLNAYCQITIGGHKSLSLAFSPCGEQAIEALPYDYPTGRAARFAYFSEPGEFKVVEGASGEKGPFHTLAAGDFRRGDPLIITLLDEGTPIAAITLEDWSAQASTGTSPTAGWLVPMNSIEFQRLGDKPSSLCSIWISLAATSVGRGWDTVGHRAGVYRNRMHVKILPAAN